jgi:hypothetical protein
MQQLLGSLLKVIGALILGGAVVVGLIGCGLGVREAMMLSGPSQYGLLFFILRWSGLGFGIGLALFLLGRWLVRVAPPLEEASFPLDPSNAP